MKQLLFVLILSVINTEYLTQSEVAHLRQVDIRTVRNWTRKGLLHAYRYGHRVFYKRCEVLQQLPTSKAVKP